MMGEMLQSFSCLVVSFISLETATPNGPRIYVIREENTSFRLGDISVEKYLGR